MQLLKKLGKFICYAFSIIVLGSGIAYIIYNKPIPKGEKGTKADALARKMLHAIHQKDFAKTRYLEWSFNSGSHQYKWNIAKEIVTVQWKSNLVTLHLSNPDKNKVIVKNKRINISEKNILVKKAIAHFNNDSFWLIAPFKVFDKGTERSIVILENGEEALLVTHTLGGSTPGDSYLWKLEPNGLPKSFQMWVKIIPIGGIEATWDDWKKMQNGVLLPTKHKIGPITLSMGNVKALP
ncbi:hypothetical protein [uncultured Maribacter sp.]|uniref:hypothetical protein n=1 Tax=uncultured Maribacter sp. TaxID=431308 RepID=UPI0026140747|nr:hypothetical protein [uncultured Maribacter sp.]